MRILQYFYFALRSESISAASISDRLQMEPDDVIERGSSSVPLSHPRHATCGASWNEPRRRWTISCGGL